MQIEHSLSQIGKKPEIFSKYIQFQRNVKKLSLKDAAKQIGITPRALELIEDCGLSAHARIKPLIRIAQFYKIPHIIMWKLIETEYEQRLARPPQE